MKSRHAPPRRSGLALLASLALALVPTLGWAAEGDGVVLNFSGSDRNWIVGALVLGVLALLYGLSTARWVLAQSPGDERMQDVGLAIREGAQAYLKKQIATMLPFVALLAAGLYFLYGGLTGRTGALIALCFVVGVAASYVAGYAGMTIAVAANMRTADAARRSYKKALEVAFRSGSVAGLVTVGVGLIGASGILLLFPAQATTLLVGFGFGGSLAALFMRVGGGIFTKAADVGADLVGKVEAGIPEDDPRNPAVIADNVGDNVGDCAGMAADVFESYAVTLVAAIVLGAATSAIFDQSVWTKLVLFALVAKGVGILASAFGMQFVKGSDNLNADPLKAIRRGFYTAAATSVLGIGLVASLLMGGVRTNNLKTIEGYQAEAIATILAARDRAAAEKKIEPSAVAAADVLKDPAVAALALGPQAATQIGPILGEPAPTPPPAPSGYARVTSADAVAPGSDALKKALGYALQTPRIPGATTPPADPFTTVGAAFLGNAPGSRFVAALVRVKGTPEQRDPKGNVIAPARPEETRWQGPLRESELDAAIKSAPAGGVAAIERKPFDLYYSARDDRFLLALDGAIPSPVSSLSVGPQVRQSLSYFAVDVPTLKGIADKLRSGAAAGVAPPPQRTIGVAVAEHRAVPWWLFVLPVAFGVLMGLVIEGITNYYVSTGKRPTREVAGVSTAGAAPMIIQGFASAAESSVFMVLAIVAALLVPLYIFPAALYGGTILAFYGTALVGLGLLTTTAFVLAMDTFGPISDNAQGVYEMSGADRDNHQGAIAVGRLDAAGNTTKALTKGFAIATAVIAAVALFHTFVESAHLEGVGLRLDLPEIFLGLLIGGAAPYLFSAFSINAVGRAAFELINEVRRQFRGDAGILKGTSKPDYGRCVAIVTAAAQRELLGPGILAIFLPMAVAFGFSIGKAPTYVDGRLYNLSGAQALGGFLAGAIVSGQLMAVLLSNAGGMWDNAKKIIEDGEFGGKGSEAHKASIVCDTVGDPFKDTAGPALNPLIKVMNLVALLLVGVVVRPLGNGVLVAVTLACVGMLAVAFYLSKKGSIAETMARLAVEGGGEIPSVEGTPLQDPPTKPRIVVGDED